MQSSVFFVSLDKMAGLSFHIPFCKRVCAYCDFYKSVDLRCMDPLLESMHRELDARREYLGGEPVRARYFGGGTPSLPTTSPPPTSPRCAARASTACRSASSRSTTRVSS